MPTYEITSPDGRKFRVTAPAGATKDDVLAYAQQNATKTVAQPQTNVADEYGPIQAGLVAAGRTLDRLYKGGKDLALTVPAALGVKGAQDERARMEREEAENTRLFQQLEDKRPVATFLGGAAPLMAAPVLGTGMAGMAAGAAVPGLLEYGTPQERLERGALGAAGGAAGAALGKVLGRAVQPFRDAPTQSQKAAQEAAKRLGVNLRADELTGSRPLAWMTGALNDLPISGGMAQKAEAARAATINRAAAKAIGQSADDLGGDVLARAADDIGASIRGAVKGEEITLTKGFQSGLNALESVNKARKGFASAAIDDVVAKARSLGDKIDGDLYQDLRSELSKQARDAFRSNDNARAHALDRVRKLLDSAADASLPQDKSAALKAARRQWANLETLERGMVVENGNVSPARMASALRQQYDKAYRRGKLTGELADIAKLGAAYKPLPQSGTAPRAIYSAIASGQLLHNPAGTAGMFAAPPLAQGLLQSSAGKRYLTSGLLDVSPEFERALMLLGAGGASGGLLSAQ